MLPNIMWLNKAVEDELKKQKELTGITPNVAARIAFFKSIEAGFVYDKSQQVQLNGTLKLDKVTWLGMTQLATELLLKQKYPEYTDKNLQVVWAAYVAAGISSVR
jgi:DNA sulfur modification protein DndE